MPSTPITDQDLCHSIPSYPKPQRGWKKSQPVWPDV